MRRVRIALFLLAVGACGKSGGGSAPSASNGSAVATAAPAPVRDDVLKSVAMTELAAGTRADNIIDGVVAVITDKAIIIDGRAMVVVSGGAVDPAELEGGANGLRIPRITAWAEQYKKLPSSGGAPMLLAVKPDVPTRVALQVITSFAQAGQNDFAFLVRTPDGTGMVPVHLPERDAVVANGPGATAPANPEDMPIQMVLSVTPTHALLWSISGLEGTLAAPKLELTPAAGGAWLSTVRDTLADIVNRRWGGGLPRPDTQKTIVVMVDPSLGTGDLVAAIAAVRNDAKGQPLYPDVMLSMGFEDTPVAKAPGEPPPKPKSDDHAVALQEEEAARFAAMLTADSSNGYTVGELSDRRPGSDLGAQIDAVRESGQQVAVGGGSRGDRGGTAMVGTGRGPRIDGPGDGTGSDAAAQAPSGRIAVAGTNTMDETSLTPDVVIRKVQAVYMAGIKRCYKNGLKMDPTMRGKVAISFTVNEAGRSVDASVKGFSDEVDQCMQGLIASWVFPRPKDVDGEATDAAFRITLTLTPD